jgi:hypothetical protein
VEPFTQNNRDDLFVRIHAVRESQQGTSRQKNAVKQNKQSRFFIGPKKIPGPYSTWPAVNIEHI